MPLTPPETRRAGRAAAAPAAGGDRPTSEPSFSAPPRDLAELSFRLRRFESDDRGTLADIADYAIAHPYEIAFGTRLSVARRCAASPTSVGRLARSLGFNGFSDMRGLFRRHLRESRSRQDDRPPAGSFAAPLAAIYAAPSIGDERFPRGDRPSRKPP